MPPKDLEALAWEEWDRKADAPPSPSQDLLSTQPGGDAARALVREVADALAKLEELEPPADLPHRIEAALPQPAQTPAQPTRQPAGVRGLARLLRRAPAGSSRAPHVSGPGPSLRDQRTESRSHRPTRTTLEREGTTTMTHTPARKTNRRLVLIAAVGVAAIGLALAIGSNFPPTAEETAGAIGGVERAERYRAETIKPEDITLDAPEVQEVVQSDEFQEILANPELREALASDAMRAVLSNDKARNVFTNDFLRNALENDQLRNALQNDQLRAALAGVISSDELRGGFYGGEDDAYSGSDAVRAAFASDALRGVLANDQQRAVFVSSDWRNVIAADELRAVFTNDAVRAVFAGDAVRAVFASDELRAVFAGDALRGVFTNDQARAILANDSLRAVFANDQLRNALENDSFRNVLQYDQIRNVLASDSLRAVFASDSMRAAISNDSLRAVGATR